MNLLRGCLAGEYPISSAEELKDADAIIAQSFGTRERGGSPGRVNAILAEHASALALKYRLPIIAQEEIHDALPDPTGAFRVSGEASATDGSGLDSWALLQRAHDLIGGGGSQNNRATNYRCSGASYRPSGGSGSQAWHEPAAA